MFDLTRSAPDETVTADVVRHGHRLVGVMPVPSASRLRPSTSPDETMVTGLVADIHDHV